MRVTTEIMTIVIIRVEIGMVAIVVVARGVHGNVGVINRVPFSFRSLFGSCGSPSAPCHPPTIIMIMNIVVRGVGNDLGTVLRIGLFNSCDLMVEMGMSMVI